MQEEAQGTRVAIRGEPACPHDSFSPLRKAPKSSLNYAVYRLFTFLGHCFPPVSINPAVEPHLLAEDGLFLTNDNEKTVQCQFCFNISTPLPQLMEELRSGSSQDIRNWHLEKSPYCPIGCASINNFRLAPNEQYLGFEVFRLLSLIKATVKAPGLWGEVDPLNRCLEMARSGFFSVGPGDKVRCHFCYVELQGWSKDDSVEAVHVKESPACPFLNDRCTVEHVPIGDERLHYVAHDAVPFQGQTDTGMRTAFPNYMELQVREDSFKLNWPHQEFFPAAAMADSGFFFTGKADLVACCNCGVGLYDWNPNETLEEVNNRLHRICQQL